MTNPPAYQYYAADFDIYTATWSVKEVGQFVRYLVKLWKDKKFNELKKYPFIGRIYKGRSYRQSIRPSIKKQILAIGKCGFCGSIENLTVDHIKPYSKGGTHDLSNLQCLCSKCNRMKYDKYDG